MDKDEVFDFLVDIEEAIDNEDASKAGSLLSEFESAAGWVDYIDNVRTALEYEVWDDAKEYFGKMIYAYFSNTMDKFFYKFVKYDRWLEKLEYELIETAKEKLSEKSPAKYAKVANKIRATRIKYSKSGNKFVKRFYESTPPNEDDIRLGVSYIGAALRRMGLTYQEKMLKRIKKLER